MGIKDLLLSISTTVENTSITAFSGQRVAIDASGWLHKGLYGAAEDYVDSNFDDAQLYVDFILSRVRTMLLNNVEPVVVFDGKRSNLKNETQEKRGDARRSNVDQGKRLLENMSKVTDAGVRGKLRQEAISNFQKGLSVTTQMEKNTIGALRKMGVKVVVSPYEADSQLAYLCYTGYCQAVLTEDSDVLVYSAICGTPFPILYKFEKGGTCQSACMKDIMPALLNMTSNDVPPAHADTGITIGGKAKTGAAPQKPATSAKGKVGKGKAGTKDKCKDKDKEKGKEKVVPIKGFLNLLALHFSGPQGRRMFVQMCILAGCDYVDSIPGVGLVTALQAVVRCREGACDTRLDRVVELFRELKKKVPETYLLRAKRAEALFHYHPVFDLDSCTVVPFMCADVGLEEVVPTPSPFPNLHIGSQIEPFPIPSPGLTTTATTTATAIATANAIKTEKSSGKDLDQGSGRSTRKRSDSIESIEDVEESPLPKYTSKLQSSIKKEKEGESVKAGSKRANTANLEISIPPLEQDSIRVFKPPKISHTDLAQMGATNAGQDLLRTAPAHVSLIDLCLGVVSCKDFEAIIPKYPWAIQKYAKPPAAQNRGGYWSGYWSSRRTLMLAEKANGVLGIKIRVNMGIKDMNLRAIFIKSTKGTIIPSALHLQAPGAHGAMGKSFEQSGSDDATNSLITCSRAPAPVLASAPVSGAGLFAACFQPGPGPRASPEPTKLHAEQPKTTILPPPPPSQTLATAEEETQASAVLREGLTSASASASASASVSRAAVAVDFSINDLTYISDDDSMSMAFVYGSEMSDSHQGGESMVLGADAAPEVEMPDSSSTNSTNNMASASTDTKEIDQDTDTATEKTPYKHDSGYAASTKGKVLTEAPDSTEAIDRALATPSTGGSGATGVSTASTIPTPEMPLHRIVPEEVTPDEEELVSASKRPYNPFKKNSGAGTPSLASRMGTSSPTSSPVRASPASPSTKQNRTAGVASATADWTTSEHYASSSSSSSSPSYDCSPARKVGHLKSSAKSPSAPTAAGTTGGTQNPSPSPVRVNLSPLKNITNNSKVVDLTMMDTSTGSGSGKNAGNGGGNSSANMFKQRLNFAPAAPFAARAVENTVNGSNNKRKIVTVAASTKGGNGANKARKGAGAGAGAGTVSMVSIKSFFGGK